MSPKLQTFLQYHSNKMDNSLLAVRDINHKYIVVEKRYQRMIFAEKRVFNGILQGNVIKLKRTKEIHTRWKLIF